VSIRLQCWLIPIYLLMGSKQLVAEDTAFRYPLAVAATSDGIVYVADRQLPGIWKIDSDVRTVYFQASKELQTPLNAVRCLALDHEGNLLAGDSSTRDIYRLNASGSPTPLTNGRIGIPMSISVAEDGMIYVADLELHRIWKMPAEGSSPPEELAAINSPRGLSLDTDGNLWVLSTSSESGQIQMIRQDGTVVPFVQGHPFRLPHSIVRMPDGSFYVTDNYSRCIWSVSSKGGCEKWLQGHPLDRPVGLCRLHDDLLIADPHIRTIFRVTPDQTVTVLTGSDNQQNVDNAE